MLDFDGASLQRQRASALDFLTVLMPTISDVRTGFSPLEDLGN